MKRTLYIITAALLAVSCVYPFAPDGIESEKRLVIEGDILIGDVTEITIRSTTPINYDKDYDSSIPPGNAWVEDGNGKVYSGDMESDGRVLKFHIDTRNASAGLRYRMHFEEDEPPYRQYVSSWQEVVKAPEIEGMSFDYDDNNVKLRMNVEGDDVQYFRWNYTEDWEYHADYLPYYHVDTERWAVLENAGRMPDQSNYWCWSHYESTDIGLASTEDLSANRLENQLISKRERSNMRFQSYYRINVSLRGLSKDAYEYLRNMKEISDITGSLFAPSPDDMRGNIVCRQDSTEFVIGFISAVEMVRDTMYITNSQNGFYKAPVRPSLIVPVFDKITTIETYYKSGNRPVDKTTSSDGSDAVGWQLEKCINCQLLGGSKKRPDNWPTFNY